MKTASPWKQVAEYVMHRDATGGATIPHTDGHGTTLVSADGIAHAIDHARIIDRYLEALEAWRSCYAAFCLQHGRVAAEGQWYIDTYAREWDDYPDFIFLGFHVDGESCLMFAHGLPNGDVVGEKL